jgi:hypothetical protein
MSTSRPLPSQHTLERRVKLAAERMARSMIVNMARIQDLRDLEETKRAIDASFIEGAFNYWPQQLPINSGAAAYSRKNRPSRVTTDPPTPRKYKPQPKITHIHPM